MANNSNTKIVNGYAFKIVDGKIVPDTKENLKRENNLTATTKRVAMDMVHNKTQDAGLGL